MESLREYCDTPQIIQILENVSAVSKYQRFWWGKTWFNIFDSAVKLLKNLLWNVIINASIILLLFYYPIAMTVNFLFKVCAALSKLWKSWPFLKYHKPYFIKGITKGAQSKVKVRNFRVFQLVLRDRRGIPQRKQTALCVKRVSS